MAEPHQSDVTTCRARLASGEMEERVAAVADLARCGYEAVADLLTALRDSEWRVRKSAVEALVGLGWRADMAPHLIAGVADPDNASLRNAAAEVLVRFGLAAVPALLAAVPSAEPDVQKFVVDILGDIGDRRATTVLVRLVGQTDENVAMAAVEALGKLRDPRAVEPLADLLRQGRPLLQFSAVKALQEIGDGRAVEPLVGCLGKPTLERAALEALGRIGDGRVVNPLAQAIRLGSSKVRHVAVRAVIELYGRMPPDVKTKIICRMREIYDEPVSRYLRDSLAGGDAAVKRNAITVLGWMGDVQAIAALAAVYDESCREELVAACVRMQREGVPKLLAVIPRAPAGLREDVARALGEIGDRKAVHGLVELTGDPEGHVRQAAAAALGQLADPLGVRPLLQLLADPYPNVQEAAYRALTRLKSPGLVSRLLGLLDGSTVEIHCYAARLLGAFQAPEAHGRLMLDLKDPDPMIRRTGLAALESLGGDVRTVAHVALNDEDPTVRLEMIRILARRRDAVIDDLIRPLLHDPDIWIRAEVIRLLGERGAEGIEETLLLLVNDPVGLIQIAVCVALGTRKVRGALPAMIRLFSSNDPDVKQAAIAAAGEIGGEQIAEPVIPMLDHAHWGVRAASAVALGRARVTRALPRLRELAAQDPDHVVRESAHFAVEQLTMALDEAS
ncbi:MAG: HEAT repeat domain-containing protein [Nitrospirota bacterium]